MASNHEFTLIPPNMVPSSTSGQAGTSNFGIGPMSRKGMTEFKILLPDNTLYVLQLPLNCTGHDCIDQVRDNLNSEKWNLSILSFFRG